MSSAFSEFVERFPSVPMPVVLGEDTHHVFSQENKPLPEMLTARFILPYEETPPEGKDLVEYVPCFAIANTERFVALVWWKAALLSYEYVLATYTPKGELIDRRTIAYTRVEGDKVRRAVSTIDEDWNIFIAEGEASSDDDSFDPTTSRMRELELTSEGRIV
ncbi:MAG: hypothetical protein NZM43_07685 [Saprospiraceae bacterium]|nr:hypothetical protein [Saprospiraceae bacterium]MDW8484187.1 hypothetical protein [Saprospiraceae bacterium]